MSQKQTNKPTNKKKQQKSNILPISSYFKAAFGFVLYILPFFIGGANGSFLEQNL